MFCKKKYAENLTNQMQILKEYFLMISNQPIKLDFGSAKPKPKPKPKPKIKLYLIPLLSQKTQNTPPPPPPPAVIKQMQLPRQCFKY
jgi:hypothetical protein